jgi:hypothetical protein
MAYGAVVLVLPRVQTHILGHHPTPLRDSLGERRFIALAGTHKPHRGIDSAINDESMQISEGWVRRPLTEPDHRWLIRTDTDG